MNYSKPHQNRSFVTDARFPLTWNQFRSSSWTIRSISTQKIIEMDEVLGIFFLTRSTNQSERVIF